VPGPRKLKLVWSPAARQDLIRLRKFIEPHNPDAARRAAGALKKATSLLAEHPAIGGRLEDREDREMFVPYGRRGYIMRYRLHEETIVIVRVWHVREKSSLT
jgi:plasmid stabilization system protein ParE